LGGSFHHLEEVLHAGNTIMSAAHVVASPELSRLAIPELDQILSVDPRGRTRVVVDQSGHEIVSPVDPDGYARHGGFVGLDTVDRGDYAMDEILEVGLVDHRFVIRRIGSPGTSLLEANELSYEAAEKPRYRDREKGRDPEWTFIDVESGRRVTGYVSPTWLGRRWYSYLLPPEEPLILGVVERDLVMADFAWYLPRLRPFLEASATTGNPIVQYHSGSSLGLD
jgi:hypothetical protein